MNKIKVVGVTAKFNGEGVVVNQVVDFQLFGDTSGNYNAQVIVNQEDLQQGQKIDTVVPKLIIDAARKKLSRWILVD